MKNIELQSYYKANEPQIIAEFGVGKPEIVFNVCAHGNEVQPLIGVEMFLEHFDARSLLRGSVRFILANASALRENKRFLVSDLNRSYPGDMTGVGEVRIAAQMLPLVANADHVVDLHTAPVSGAMVILGARNPERLALAELSGIKNIILFESQKGPVAMVDFTKCGIGIELGTHQDAESAKMGAHIIERYLTGLGYMSGTSSQAPHDYYEIIGRFDHQEADEYNLRGLKDFQPAEVKIFGVSTGVIYPVLCDPNRTYSSAFCYYARKVERAYLEGKNVEYNKEHI